MTEWVKSDKIIIIPKRKNEETTMEIFKKPELVRLKETSDAKAYLEKLEKLLTEADESIRPKIKKETAIVKAGIAGEENIWFELENSDMDLVVLQDIYIETQDGRGAQIDFIVIASKLIFLIECKNLFGNIEINSKGDFIRTIRYGNRWFKEGIYSPVTQNERHLSVLKECRTENKNGFWQFFIRKNFDDFYKSLIVLANPRTVVNDRYAKKEVKNQVIRADQLIATMKKMNAASKELPSSKKEMLNIGQSFLERNREERKDYFAKYENLLNEIKEQKENSDDNQIKVSADKLTEHQIMEENDKKKENLSVDNNITNKSDKKEKSTVSTGLVCPRCGSELVIRTAKKGKNVGNMFYGCSNFPKCRFVRNIGQPEKEN